MCSSYGLGKIGYLILDITLMQNKAYFLKFEFILDNLENIL